MVVVVVENASGIWTSAAGQLSVLAATPVLVVAAVATLSSQVMAVWQVQAHSWLARIQFACPVKTRHHHQ